MAPTDNPKDSNDYGFADGTEKLDRTDFLVKAECNHDDACHGNDQALHHEAQRLHAAEPKSWLSS